MTYESLACQLSNSIDLSVSKTWADLGAKLTNAGLKVPVNDTWIAATAITHRMAVVTQDRDYDLMPGVEVISSSWIRRSTLACLMNLERTLPV